MHERIFHPVTPPSPTASEPTRKWYPVEAVAQPGIDVSAREDPSSEFDVVKAEIKRTAPSLLEGKLPGYQEGQLGSDSYILGINQTGPATLDEALAYLGRTGGIDVANIYSLINRFRLIDRSTDPELIEKTIVGGYHQNPGYGKFIIAIPMDRGEPYTSPIEAPLRVDVTIDPTDPNMPEYVQAGYIPDFYIKDPSRPDIRLVNPKYIAGFIDDKGIYWPNQSLGTDN